MINEINFVKGICLIQQYVTEETTINIIEESSIAISELKRLPKEIINQLTALGWNAGSRDYGWAEYFKLEYLDT